MPVFSSVTLVCEENSWLLPYTEVLLKKLWVHDVKAKLVHEYSHIQSGEAAFFLGCTKVCPKELLLRNPYNLVVHESELPKGRGFAPISWTVLGGKNEIVFSLIEANEKVDTGKIYSQSKIRMAGTELCDEIRELQGFKTVELCLDFILNGRIEDARDQAGEATYFRRRTPADSKLDVHKTIAEQFDLLRIVDNQRYPAYFNYRGRAYRLKIEYMDDPDDM